MVIEVKESRKIMPDKLDVYQVVKKLIGCIEPLGETNEDNRRYENLVEMCNLIENLVEDIKEVRLEYKNDQEYSIKRAVNCANDFLVDDLGIKDE